MKSSFADTAAAILFGYIKIIIDDARLYCAKCGKFHY